MNDILVHHGILGQKWGVRRFQNEDGSLTEAGKKRYAKDISKLRKLDEKKEKILRKLPEKKYYAKAVINPGRNPNPKYVDTNKKADLNYQNAQLEARYFFNKMQKRFKNVLVKDISEKDIKLIKKYLKNDDYMSHVWNMDLGFDPSQQMVDKMLADAAWFHMYNSINYF